MTNPKRRPTHASRKAAPTTKTTRAPHKGKRKKKPMTSRTEGTHPSGAVGPEGFSIASLRSGALRLLMLAASFEHRPTGARDRTIERQVRRVLNIIEPHVESNAAAEMRARVARLSTRIAAFYELYRHDVDFAGDALEFAMKNMLEVEGYVATADALDELVPADQEIRADGGPQEAADFHLGAVLAVSPKSIENWRHGKVPVGTQLPFGVQVGPLNIVRHVVEMLLAQSSGPELDLEKVKALVVELIEAKHSRVTPSLSRLSATRGRSATKLEL